MGERSMNDRSSLLMLGLVLVTVGCGIFMGAVHAAEGVRNASAPDLDRFMPEGIDRFYHREDCKLATAGPCALWVAGEQDARYMIFGPREGSTRETIGAGPLLRSVLPDGWTSVSRSLTPSFDSA